MTISAESAKSDHLEQAPQTERSIEILDAAVRIFAEKGYTQTDVQEIADRVGVGKGTVYRHFGNKEALFEAAVTHARDKLIAAVDGAKQPEMEGIEQLRRCITAILQFFDSLLART